MRAPGFWWTRPGERGFAASLLAPLGRLYAAGTSRRLRSRKPLAVGIPVICVGNLVVGGSGKTPVAIAIAGRLMARGRAVHVVTRGYGGRLRGPVRVDPDGHSAAEVGDEALLLAAFAPVWVARDRVAGARAAKAAGAEVLILDDGFQDPALAKSLSLVVVDAARGFGNGLCIPAGPLREPVATGLARADLVVAIGETAARDEFRELWGAALSRPVVEAILAPLATGMDWRGLRSFAFAGIGDPEKFFSTLRGLGADVVRAVPLDDHQPISPALLARLRQEASSLGAQLVTTEKDAVRLAPGERGGVLTLPVRLEVADWTLLDAEFARLGV
jgi:tetraacyldisaccharide 4'-kinase